MGNNGHYQCNPVQAHRDRPAATVGIPSGHDPGQQGRSTDRRHRCCHPGLGGWQRTVTYPDGVRYKGDESDGDRDEVSGADGGQARCLEVGLEDWVPEGEQGGPWQAILWDGSRFA